MWIRGWWLDRRGVYCEEHPLGFECIEQSPEQAPTLLGRRVLVPVDAAKVTFVDKEASQLTPLGVDHVREVLLAESDDVGELPNEIAGAGGFDQHCLAGNALGSLEGRQRPVKDPATVGERLGGLREARVSGAATRPRGKQVEGCGGTSCLNSTRLKMSVMTSPWLPARSCHWRSEVDARAVRTWRRAMCWPGSEGTGRSRW